jgi:hypothetical protein
MASSTPSGPGWTTSGGRLETKADASTRAATPAKNSAPVGARRRALLRDITREKLTFTLCAAHYEALSLRLTVPTIVITAFSGFVSFLGASDIIPAEWKDYISLSVGLMATVATILGGLAQQFKYGNRAESFNSAAQQYGILEHKLEFSIRANAGKRMGDEFYNLVETQILDIAKSMKYFPPQNKVKSWTKRGLIEALEEQTPLPKYLKPWHKSLKELGVTEAKDMVFLTRENIQRMKPAMPEVVIQKALADALNEQTDQGIWGQSGGIAESNELFKALSPHAQRRVSMDVQRKMSAEGLAGGVTAGRTTKVMPVGDSSSSSVHL